MRYCTLPISDNGRIDCIDLNSRTSERHYIGGSRTHNNSNKLTWLSPRCLSNSLQCSVLFVLIIPRQFRRCDKFPTFKCPANALADKVVITEALNVRSHHRKLFLRFEIIQHARCGRLCNLNCACFFRQSLRNQISNLVKRECVHWRLIVLAVHDAW